MDLNFTAEETAFREEVRAFVRASLPDAIRAKVQSSQHLSRDEHIQWQRILHAHGWGGVGWLNWPYRFTTRAKTAGSIYRAFSSYMDQPEANRAEWLSNQSRGLGGVVYHVWQMLGVIETEPEATDAG